MSRVNKFSIINILSLGIALIFLSGFDMSRHSVPLNEIKDGGPGKDGIPAVTHPRFVSAETADEKILYENDRVIGVFMNGKVKAYPIRILNWHEIVNDKIGGRAVVVTFCPLCGTGMVFDGKIKGREKTFGVSGLLYQSDMLLYDHQTESLWSQIMGEAVTGEEMGAKLKLLPSTQTTWEAWKKKHPKTLVLSLDTGHPRDYSRDPYKGYYKSRRIMFGVKNMNNSIHPKEQVIGIEIEGHTKAYPFTELKKAGKPVEDKLGGQSFRVYYDAPSRTAVIRDSKGKELPAIVGFWFAWYAFHPKTEVFKENR